MVEAKMEHRTKVYTYYAFGKMLIPSINASYLYNETEYSLRCNHTGVCSSVLCILNWHSLQKRRELARLVLVHPCVNNQAPAELNKLFGKNCYVQGNQRTRVSNNIYLAKQSSEFARKSF